MQSTTLINLNLQYPNYSTTMHAVQLDKLSRVVTANLFDGSVPFIPDQYALGMVRYHKADNTSGFYDMTEDDQPAVTWQGNVATIHLTEQALTCAGIVLCQVQFYKESGERLTTFTWKIIVEENTVTDNEIMSTDYYSVLSEQISAALSITYRPPYINSTTGNWMVWSTQQNDYVDSGYSAKGAKGDPGVPGAYVQSITRISGTGAAGETDTYQVNLSNGAIAGTFQVYNGENGAYVSGITKISGTGAGGTQDTYRVDLSDGTSAGTFTVYNGADGQGSPGSALPLENGTAAAGSATAYSREDHVHPSDSSKVDKETGKGLSSNDFTTTLKNKLDGIAEGADVSPDGSDSNPSMNGTAAAGVSDDYSRADHVHPSDTSRQIKNVYHQNVSASSWASDSTYNDFSYKGTIALQGVTTDMLAEVIFAPTQALSGDYAPVCQTYNGGVYIWSKSNTTITIPTIVIMG